VLPEEAAAQTLTVPTAIAPLAGGNGKPIDPAVLQTAELAYLEHHPAVKGKEVVGHLIEILQSVFQCLV